MYIVQSLQLQFSSFQHFIWLLKIESVLACLIIFGKVDQSLFPKKDIVSIRMLLYELLEAASRYHGGKELVTQSYLPDGPVQVPFLSVIFLMYKR